MDASRQDLKEFTAGWIEERLGYDKPVAEDIAEDFVDDDFPLNGIKTIHQAAEYLEEVATMLAH